MITFRRPQSEAIGPRQGDAHKQPTPRPLTPGAQDAWLLRRIWQTPNDTPVMVRRASWPSLAIALEHLHLAHGRSIVVRAQAPKFVREIAGPVLAPHRIDVRPPVYAGPRWYETKLGSDVMFQIEVIATSGKSATVRRYVDMPTDLPLHIALAGARR